MKEIILASQSPRRLHLLQAMGVKFIVEPSDYDEKLDNSRLMSDVAMELALGKAMDVAAKHPSAIIIGSDTIVGVDGKQLEKPVDIDEARQMLLSYVDKQSEVVTGVAVVCIEDGVQLLDSASSLVYFKSDSPTVKQLREEYLATENWRDKAGGYGYQAVRDTLIERIDGDDDTIIGFPTKLVARMLYEVGVETDPVVIDPDELYGT